MIKVSVMYPNGEGAAFDMDYYRTRHMPWVRETLGAVLKDSAIDQGLSQPGSPAPFLAIGHLVFDSLGDVSDTLSAHGPGFMADIPNFTNAKPVIQVSEIIR